MRTVLLASRSAPVAVRSYAVQSGRVPFGAVSRPTSVGVSVPATESLEQSSLESGVRVLSVDSPTPTTSISLIVKAGSRYEDRQTLGAASFLKHLAYKGSADKSALRLVRDLEHVGATMTVTVDREHIAYHVQGLRPSSSQDIGLAVMAESLRAVTQPTLLEYEVEAVRALVLHDTHSRPQRGDLALRDKVHAEHFADTGLARAPQALSASVAQRSPQQLHRFVSEQFLASNMAIVGVGIEHATLTRALSQLFTAQGIRLRAPYFELRSLPKLGSVAATSQNLSKAYASKPTLLREEDEGVAQLVVSYKGVSNANAKDLLALEVFAEVLGTGSLDAFNPSRTAHRSSRLSRSSALASANVSAYAFVDSYSDAGLFGVYASASDASVSCGSLWSSLHSEVRSSLDSLSDEDVSRALNSLRSKLAAHLPTQRTALAESLLAHAATPSARASLASQITRADVARVASAVLASAPVVAARGDVSGIKL